MREALKNQRGISLVESLVGVAILGIIVVSSVYLVHMGRQTTQWSKVNLGLLSTQSSLGTIMRFEQICTQAIGKDAFSATGDTPLHFDVEGLQWGAGAELKEAQVRIKSLMFKNPVLSHTQKDGSKIYAGSVEMIGENLHGDAANDERVFLRHMGGLALEVTTAGLIRKCYGDSMPEVSCTRLGGAYDAAQTPACRLSMPGCPQAQEVPTYNADGSMTCKNIRVVTGEECGADEILISNGTSASCVSLNQPSEDKCFTVVCISDAGAWNSFRGNTDSEGVMYRTSPSMGSTWVTRLARGTRALERHNCWSDQFVATLAGGPLTYSNSNVDVCKTYGPRGMTHLPSATFNGGYAKDFRGCEVQRCGSAIDNSYNDGQIYHWAGASYDVDSKKVKVRLRTNTWSAFTPDEVPFDLELPDNTCQNRTIIRNRNAGGGQATTNYNICASGRNLTVRVNGHTMTIPIGEIIDPPGEATAQ